MTTTWRESIDKLVNTNELLVEKKDNSKLVELTYDTALERLMKANRHVDELSAKILLERSLVFENETLEFSRDPGIPKYVNIF